MLRWFIAHRESLMPPWTTFRRLCIPVDPNASTLHFWKCIVRHGRGEILSTLSQGSIPFLRSQLHILVEIAARTPVAHTSAILTFFRSSRAPVTQKALMAFIACASEEACYAWWSYMFTSSVVGATMRELLTCSTTDAMVYRARYNIPLGVLRLLVGHINHMYPSMQFWRDLARRGDISMFQYCVKRWKLPRYFLFLCNDAFMVDDPTLEMFFDLLPCDLDTSHEPFPLSILSILCNLQFHTIRPIHVHTLARIFKYEGIRTYPPQLIEYMVYFTLDATTWAAAKNAWGWRTIRQQDVELCVVLCSVDRLVALEQECAFPKPYMINLNEVHNCYIQTPQALMLTAEKLQWCWDRRHRKVSSYDMDQRWFNVFPSCNHHARTWILDHTRCWPKENDLIRMWNTGNLQSLKVCWRLVVNPDTLLRTFSKHIPTDVENYPDMLVWLYGQYSHVYSR